MTMTGPDPVHIPEIDSCTHSNRHDTLADVNAIRVTSTSGPSQDSPDRQDVHKHGDLHATMSCMHPYIALSTVHVGVLSAICWRRLCRPPKQGFLPYFWIWLLTLDCSSHNSKAS